MEVDIKSKLDKLFSVEATEMELMLSMLDIQHSIVIDKNIGLIGEFEDKPSKELSDTLMTLKGLKEKRGDYFIVVGSMGTIILPENVKHTFIIQDNDKEITRYAFILNDIKKVDELESFFLPDDEVTYGDTLVIYDSVDESFRTNNKETNYTYDKNIRLEKIIGKEYTLSDNYKEYTSILIDSLNNISVLMEITD